MFFTTLASERLAQRVLGQSPEHRTVDSGFYAACAGLRARTQALEIVANNLANLNATGYSSSQVDQRKVGKLATAIQTAFQQLGVFPGSEKIIVMDPSRPIPFNTVQAIEDAERTAARERLASAKTLAGASENGDLSSLRQELEDALASEIQKNEVAVTVGPDGLVVSLREIGFFDSGSSKIRETSLSAFSRIAWLLAERPYRVRIEGHTDNQPIHNTQFSDNWDLSTSRATELVRLLIVKYGFAPGRLSAAGYAEYHPGNSNDTPEARAQNRRVDVVILGRTSMNRSDPSGGVAQNQASSSAPTAVLPLSKPSPAIPAGLPQHP